MNRFTTNLWRQIPIFRILLPFATGIIVQFYGNVPLVYWVFVSLISGFLWMIYTFLPLHLRFRMQFFKGFNVMVIYLSIGSIVCSFHSPQNQKNNITNLYKSGNYVVVTALDKPVPKNKTYKVVAEVESILQNGTSQPSTGKLILYFKKEGFYTNITCGSRLNIKADLVPISNAGNPGSFDYKQYCSFQNIGFQTFLKEDDYTLLPEKKEMPFLQSVLDIRDATLASLQKFITNKETLSIAEALLIGYREDLDKNLVQAYSNTGVVHIIAISGLHLGMIYGLLVWLFKPFRKIQFLQFLKPFCILFVLWMFTFVAGAVPSILRSAIMFSFVVIGESFNKKSSILNNLALSAFIILLFSPFSLWDVGFQLSYAAVFSIVLFNQHVQRIFFIQNKILKNIWQLCAVTLSAQILTLPFVVYHFHQFPNLFLISNLIAVPLSGFILYAELLFLVVVPFSNEAASFIAVIISKMIDYLNQFILFINQHPFAVWNGISISPLQAMLLLMAFFTISYWMIEKKKSFLWVSLTCICLLTGLRYFDFIQKENQHQLIVFNIPHYSALDIIEGRNAVFVGDDELTEDGFLRNFHIQPSRILNRYSIAENLPKTVIDPHYILSNKKTVLIIDDSFPIHHNISKISADAIILKENPKLTLPDLQKITDCSLIIADGSNPQWKIKRWKKEAENLHLRLHSVTDQGAFIMDL